MANLRPQNLPLSAIYCKFYYFSWKILVFTILKPKCFFLSDKVPKVSIVPFFYFPIISFKVASLFKTVILKAVQSVSKLLLLPALTSHLNRVLSSFSFTLVTICAVSVIYGACCFVFVFAAGVLFPCTWFLTRYGKIPWFRSEKGKIFSAMLLHTNDIHNSAIGPTSILSIKFALMTLILWPFPVFMKYLMQKYFNI